ncbi:hypothetical protein C8R42DRAFT_715141 [Lentinula raphanica]|nr:hypothetical protein C8R42DRAFT_715141 [Lentinula raphanica]
MPLVHVVIRLIRAPVSSLLSLRRFSLLGFAVCLINSIAVIAPPIDWQQLGVVQSEYECSILLSIMTFSKGNIRMELPSIHIDDQYFGDPAAPVPHSGNDIGKALFISPRGNFNWPGFWSAKHQDFASRFSEPLDSTPDPRPYEGSIDGWRSLHDVMQGLKNSHVINDMVMSNWRGILNSALTIKAEESISLIVYLKRGSVTSEVSLLIGDAGKIISPDHVTPIIASNRKAHVFPIGTVARDVHIDTLRNCAASNHNHQFRGNPEDIAKWTNAEKELASKRKGRSRPDRDHFKEWKWADTLMECARPYFSEETQNTYDEQKRTLLDELITHLRDLKESNKKSSLKTRPRKKEKAGTSSQGGRS